MCAHTRVGYADACVGYAYACMCTGTLCGACVCALPAQGCECACARVGQAHACACTCVGTGVCVRTCACVGRWVGQCAQDSSPALECVCLALQAPASLSFRKGTTSGRAAQPQTEADLAGCREGEGGQAAGAAGVWGWQCLPHWGPNSSVLPCWGRATTLPLCGPFPKKPVV